MKLKVLFSMALVLCALMPPAQATTLTGADIFAQATFPTGGATLNGTSLVIGPSSLYTYQKMLSLPVSTFLDGNTLDVSFDMTRLACAYSCGGDSNPIIGISDGNIVIVLAPGEDFNGALGVSAWYDLGDQASSFLYAITLATNVGYPDIGGNYNFTLHYEFGATGTYTEGAMNAATISYSHPYALNTSNLHLVLFHDNDFGEQYQINALDFPNVGVDVAVDIKPGSCPNPLNAGSGGGVVSVAINSDGTTNVTDIDPATVRLAGVAPLRSAYEDVSTPYAPYAGKENRTDCSTEGADGLLDLVFKFDKGLLVDALGGSALVDGDVIVVPLTGALRDGTPIVGEDVMWIRNSQ